MLKNYGFTLLEVLIALVLFVLGVVVIAGLFSTGLANSVDAEKITIAMDLAQRRMEEIRNLDFDTGIIDEAKASIDGFSGFQRQVTVTEPETDLKEVTVTVYWTFKAEEISTSLETYISRN